jgi:hypothetical protein
MWPAALLGTRPRRCPAAVVEETLMSRVASNASASKRLPPSAARSAEG